MTFTYYQDGEPKEMVITINMVRRDKVSVQHSFGLYEMFYVMGGCTFLCLDTENRDLFIQWAKRNGLPHVSQLISK
ncbi:MAG: hypothetical protein AAB445_04190 [Patescibacteria group bacterium]